MRCFFPVPCAERYRVDDVTQDAREDCYRATLHISHTDLHDSRPYYLVVENDRGIDRHAIHLKVEGSFTGALSFRCVLFMLAAESPTPKKKKSHCILVVI